MGKVREEESKKAMKLLGLDEGNLIFLGYPDYGTDAMFFSYWESGYPFVDILTHQPYVPYKESPSYGAPYKPENVLKDLKNILLDYKPNKIFVSHPADVNGDHWAYYCYLEIALLDLKNQIPKPKLYPYFVHTPGWPLPRYYHPDLCLLPSQKDFPSSLVQWKKLELTPDEVDKKHQAMFCYKSQTCVSAFYLLSFVRSNELFGDYPLIELKRQSSKGLSGQENFFNDDKVVSYAIVDDYFWIRVKKPANLKKKLLITFYIFGYTEKMPFSQTPNISIMTRYDKLKILDMNFKKEVDPKTTSIEMHRNFMILKVPLKLLGDPEFILTSLIASRDFMPFDATGFRRIQILKE
jgi:LmbE family N-acetylglucosaminyl deacetylase